MVFSIVYRSIAMFTFTYKGLAEVTSAALLTSFEAVALPGHGEESGSLGRASSELNADCNSIEVPRNLRSGPFICRELDAKNPPQIQLHGSHPTTETRSQRSLLPPLLHPQNPNLLRSLRSWSRLTCVRPPTTLPTLLPLFFDPLTPAQLLAPISLQKHLR